MLRVILIDDEALARQGLREQLSALGDIEVCGEAESVKQALDAIEALQPDGLFLDVRMPQSNGFSLLKNIESPPPVVFVTAHSEYAVRAFEIDAVDYILKPVCPKRLAQAVARLRGATTKNTSEPAYGESDRICLRTPERTVVARLEDVLLLQAEGDFTRVSLAGEVPMLICQTLGIYERSLPNPPFVRLDRSVMVNISRVNSVEVSPTRGARLFLESLEKPVELGRSALRRLREAIPQVASGLE